MQTACLIAPSALGVQKLDICLSYSNENNITLNPTKTVHVVFKPKHCKIKSPAVQVDGKRIERVSNTKYLGFTFSDNGRDDNDTFVVSGLIYFFEIFPIVLMQ